MVHKARTTLIAAPGRFLAVMMTGSATVDAFDLPWPARIPADAPELPIALLIIGIPGHAGDPVAVFGRTELDRRTREALRALGYIN